MQCVLNSRPVSRLLGLIDLGSLLLRLLGSGRPRFFSKGWGNMKVPADAQEALLAQEKQELTVKITYNPDKETSGNVTLQQGSFPSPLAYSLPKESKMARFYLVDPVDATGTREKVYIIMLPATGEMGKGSRLAMAKELAAERGWSSIIVTAPYYGIRKPKGQRLFLLDTVADLMIQSQAIIEETSALACQLLNNDKSAKVCVTGFSWGAAMSACVAATTLLYNGDGTRLACAPYVGSASPVCLADGVIAASIDWRALQLEKNLESEEATREELKQELYKTQLSVISGSLSQKENFLGSLQAVFARDDHFIRYPYVQEFEQQLKSLLRTARQPQSFTWIGGGHATAMLFRSYYQKSAILSAMDNLLKSE